MDVTGMLIAALQPHEKFSTVLLGCDWAKKYSRWMMQNNQYTLSMNNQSTKSAHIGTAVNNSERGRNDMLNMGFPENIA